MRPVTSLVANVRNLVNAYDALETADADIPRMGLVFGVPGAGKTNATTWLALKTNAIYVRATPTWTPTAMLGKVMAEVGQPAKRAANENLEVIVEHMSTEARPLFVDEIDMFTNSSVRPNQSGQIIELLRSVHDLSGMPVILIGMSGVEIQLKNYKQVTSRIAQWVNFLPASLADARTLANDICEVRVEDDLLKVLHQKAGGNMRLLAIGLSKIERAAKGAKLKALGLAEWGERQFYLNGSMNGGSHGD